MRIILFLLTLILGGLKGVAQASPSAGGFGSNPTRMISMGSLGPSEPKEDIQGRFLRQQWSPAVISFRNSLDKWHVPILFDVYSNKLYFLQEKQIMEFVDTVLEFTMILPKREDSLKVTYRSFYPSINQNTTETFYEVLVDGQFQLLRCKAKTIYLYKDQEIPEEGRKYNSELLYGYFPGKQIVLIKKNKEQFLSAVPKEYQSTVQSIIDSKKLKLKNEDALRELFGALNE